MGPVNMGHQLDSYPERRICPEQPPAVRSNTTARDSLCGRPIENRPGRNGQTGASGVRRKLFPRVTVVKKTAIAASTLPPGSPNCGALRSFPAECCWCSYPRTRSRSLAKGSEKLRELARGILAPAPGPNRAQVDVIVPGNLDRGCQTLAIIPMIESCEAVSAGIRR